MHERNGRGFFGQPMSRRTALKGLGASALALGAVSTGAELVSERAVAAATIPFGGVGDSGTGSRFGGSQANLDAFTEMQWVTAQSEIPPYPF